ncbi:DegV family protein [uncultured Clostridium sp.]|uniref:DegV family protein n=1 Tax=uncultured Clostridium sp. TaxID=59620 RepID=UPI0028EAA44E|nr:DegV family protein [uncultured Clostridium sp.]
MEKIALITDTTADLTEEIIKEYNVEVLPFRIIYKDREYKDKIEITPQEVYDNFKVEVPTSSLPSMQDMEELFTRLEEEGYTHAIAITLSTGLSGIYNGVKVVSENHPKIITHVMDSKAISWGEGALAHKCGELIKEGKNFDTIVDELYEFRKKIQVYFVVGTLEYLKRGGRIGKVSGTIGELLNIKPIIAVDNNDGKYCTCDKVRGRKQSLNRMFEIIENKLKEKRCAIYIMSGDALEEAKKLHERISKLENASKVVMGGAISPVSGVHSGPGLVGIVLIEES